MSKVIIFSTQFPQYHPKKGQKTRFVEALLKSMIWRDWYFDRCYEMSKKLDYMYAEDMLAVCKEIQAKNHTIRAGQHWKVGDTFSPRIWSGKPYTSKQVIICPDIEIVKIFKFEIINRQIFIDGKGTYDFEKIARNDGLSEADFCDWFCLSSAKKKDFVGQIICWNKHIEY